jgi:hypothetical protein
VGVAAAVVVAVAAGAVGFAISDGRVRAERARVAAAQAQSARMTQILAAPDARVSMARVSPTGDITVVLSTRLNQGVAVLTNMPELPGGRVYELWLIHGNQPVPAGLMGRGVRGATTFLTNVVGATAFGVSAEKPGGATTPTMPLVTAFGLTA